MKPQKKAEVIGYHLRLHKPAELLDSRAMFFDKKD